MGSSRYKNVLKSSALIGGSAFVNILIGMARTKVVAILLGPAGMGLNGMFASLVGPLTKISGLGVSSSGVRQIAVAYGQKDENRVARTVKTLRRTVWITGFLGCLLTGVLSPWLSKLTFKSTSYTWMVALLGVIVFCENIATGQKCIIQGTRRIADIAKISILGALNGTLISIPCFYFLRENGIVLSLVLCSFASLSVSYCFSRKIKVKDVFLSLDAFKDEVRELIGIGIPLMLSGLLITVSAYLLRLIVLGRFGLAGVGIWSSAYNISGMLVNFVLSAMSTDYYPRLSAVANDNVRICEEVNIQAEIAILLAAPGLLVTMLFAPLGIKILYTEQFAAAVPILEWSIYGILFKVISWPLAYIVLAKGRGRLYLGLEILANVLSLLAMYFCSRIWGLIGTGIAFMMFNGIYVFAVAVAGWIIARTRWTVANIILIVGTVGVCVCGSLLRFFMSSSVCAYYLIAVVFTIVCTSFFFCRLAKVSGVPMKGLFNKFYRHRNG